MADKPEWWDVQNRPWGFVSPSQINKFDTVAKPQEACERRWYFTAIMKEQDPAGPAAQLGTDIHTGVESYGATGLIPAGKIGRFVRVIADHLPPPPYTDPLQTLERGFKFPTFPGGPLFTGRKDYEDARGQVLKIKDFKSTSDIRKNGKTPAQLKQEIQLVGYAVEGLLLHKHVSRDYVDIEHIYVQTRGPIIAHPVSVRLHAQEIDTRWAAAIKTIRRMDDIAKTRPRNPLEIRPNPLACRAYNKLCNFSAYCSDVSPEAPSDAIELFNKALGGNMSTQDPGAAGAPLTGLTARLKAKLQATQQAAGGSAQAGAAAGGAPQGVPPMPSEAQAATVAAPACAVCNDTGWLSEVRQPDGTVLKPATPGGRFMCPCGKAALPNPIVPVDAPARINLETPEDRQLTGQDPPAPAGGAGAGASATSNSAAMPAPPTGGSAPVAAPTVVGTSGAQASVGATSPGAAQPQGPEAELTAVTTAPAAPADPVPTPKRRGRPPKARAVAPEAPQPLPPGEHTPAQHVPPAASCAAPEGLLQISEPAPDHAQAQQLARIEQAARAAFDSLTGAAPSNTPNTAPAPVSKRTLYVDCRPVKGYHAQIIVDAEDWLQPIKEAVEGKLKVADYRLKAYGEGKGALVAALRAVLVGDPKPLEAAGLPVLDLPEAVTCSSKSDLGQIFLEAARTLDLDINKGA